MSALQEEESEPPLDGLAERLRTVCESAVDPLEIASALEFDGVSDRTARAGYQVPDVFALARLLYARVPRKPAAPEAQPDPWQVRWPLVRGVLYALPAACFPAAGALLVGPGVLPALVTALLSSWGLSQGLAAVGYTRLGMSGPAQARQVLRSGLAACLLAVALIMTVTVLIVHARPAVLAFGIGEGAYMLGACVLLVTSGERWLAVSLAPGVFGAGLFLLLGKPAALTGPTWAALAATPLIACVIAVVVTRTTGPGGRRLPSRDELLGALPAVALGVIAAGLLTFPLVAGASGSGGANIGALIASVPLALSMGAAEWSLIWYRRAVRRLLWQTDDPRWFHRRAVALLLTALAQYLAVMLVTISVALAVAVTVAHVPFDLTVLLPAAGYLLLGAAMFLVLLLQTMRVRFIPLTLAAAALCAEIVLHHYGLTVQLAAPAALLATVAVYAATRLGEAVLHV